MAQSQLGSQYGTGTQYGQSFANSFPRYPETEEEKKTRLAHQKAMEKAFREQERRANIRLYNDELQNRTFQIVGLMLQSDELMKKMSKEDIAKEARDTAVAVMALFGKNKPN